MKVEIKKQQFITMRVEGNSFEQIAKALSIEKPNLIQWNKERETRKAINEGLAIRLNDEVRTLEMGKQNRLSAMLKIYKKVINEIEQRDLSDIATDKLIQLSVLLNQKINDQNNSVEIGENEGIVTWQGGEYFDLDTLG
jgi:predicted XRE-type DNA-binding protein